MNTPPGGFAQRMVLGRLERLARRLNQTTDHQLLELRSEIDRLHTEIASQTDRLLDRVAAFETRSHRDIVYAGDQLAARESNEFARQHLLEAKQCIGANATLRYALTQAPDGGMALEFGVATGATLRVIVAERGGEIYGFDSFAGLPESWINGLAAGSFTQVQLPDVRGAELVVGLFDDTIGTFLDQHPGPVDFVHIDSDLYTSAKTVLRLVGPRLRVGSIVHFDEFYNYPGWQQHEVRAWDEYAKETETAFSYIAHAVNDCQVTIRIDSAP